VEADPARLPEHVPVAKQAPDFLFGTRPLEQEDDLVAGQENRVPLERGIGQLEGRPLAEEGADRVLRPATHRGGH
jgi:hypothetical protein